MTLAKALQILQKANAIKSPWLSGMRDAERGTRYMTSSNAIWDIDHPDITDPATKGCLLTLLREASEDNRIYVRQEFSGQRWAVHSPYKSWPVKDTEGEAIQAALITLAGCYEQ